MRSSLNHASERSLTTDCPHDTQGILLLTLSRLRLQGAGRQRSGVKCGSHVAVRQTCRDASTTGSCMDEDQKFADLRTLARMAARLAGRDPDEHVVIRIGETAAFEDVAWRYPDFLNRAEAAYKLLDSGVEF
jgi:hypothetical protein